MTNVTVDSRIIYETLPKGDYFTKIAWQIGGTEVTYIKLFYRVFESSRAIIRQIKN